MKDLGPSSSAFKSGFQTTFKLLMLRALVASIEGKVINNRSL